MSIKDKLEIILITYNREEELGETLNVILAEDSPIRDFDIKIIDNNSSDNTEAVVKSFQEKYPNLKYEKNKYNIGGNGNITKAFYIAEKEYAWILADNDHYCWDSWGEVEKAVEKGMDAIVVSDFTFPKSDVAGLYNQTTFTPGVVFKTSNISDEVMGNMTFSIYSLFPHLALYSYLINNNKAFYIVEKAIVNIGDNRSKKTQKYSYVRGYKDCDLHPLQKNMKWALGYANALYLIKDKTIRNYISTHNHNGNAINTIQRIMTLRDPKFCSFIAIFSVLSLYEKFWFVLKYLYYKTFYKIFHICYRYKRYEDMSYERKLRLKLLFFTMTLHKEILDPKKIGNKKYAYKNLYTKDNL